MSVDVAPGSDIPIPADPAEPTLEVTIPPAYVHEDRIPERVVETVYDQDAPWILGIVDVGDPRPIICACWCARSPLSIVPTVNPRDRYKRKRQLRRMTVGIETVTVELYTGTETAKHLVPKALIALKLQRCGPTLGNGSRCRERRRGRA